MTWWCSHDVSRELADFPELEYGLGLLTNDRRTKPAGTVLARVAAAWRDREHRPPVRDTALVLDETVGRSTCAPGGPFFEAWSSLTARGARPTVVLADRAQDPTHLSARGITQVLHLKDLE